MKEENTFRYYLAYGSNLNLAQMQTRCPDARVAGTAELKDRRLLFKGGERGRYLTVERAEGRSVPVAVWTVSERDERSLDRYEGFPHFYYKEELEVTLREAGSGERRTVKAFVYIMHEAFRPGPPAESYMALCREGYRDFGFDRALLDEAYAFSCGE